MKKIFFARYHSTPLIATSPELAEGVQRDDPGSDYCEYVTIPGGGAQWQGQAPGSMKLF